jgi:F-type H+-transporting ATPase subunit epsilon
MHLKVLVPTEIFADEDGVSRVTAETTDGSFGLLERRVDCAAALVPGILSYQTKQGATVYIAVDEGVLVKTGSEVLVSVRHAVGGEDLARLHTAVKASFLALDQQELSVRNAVAKMEAGLVGRFAEFEHER